MAEERELSQTELDALKTAKLIAVSNDEYKICSEYDEKEFNAGCTKQTIFIGMRLFKSSNLSCLKHW